MTKLEFKNGLMGKKLTETIAGEKVLDCTVSDVTFPNGSNVRLFFKEKTPLTISVGDAMKLMEKKTVSFEIGGISVMLAFDEPKKVTKKRAKRAKKAQKEARE